MYNFFKWLKKFNFSVKVFIIEVLIIILNIMLGLSGFFDINLPLLYKLLLTIINIFNIIFAIGICIFWSEKVQDYLIKRKLMSAFSQFELDFEQYKKDNESIIICKKLQGIIPYFKFIIKLRSYHISNYSKTLFIIDDYFKQHNYKYDIKFIDGFYIYVEIYEVNNEATN